MEAFIEPKTLARIKDMPLVARTVAEGFLHGLQSSRQRGVGIEFNQYRAYEPGDELSRIDWKLFGRSDRYYVREAERESEIEVWFLLDNSRSMQLKSVAKDKGADSWDKSNYAKHLIASLAYLAQKQGDNVGFLSLASDSLDFLPSGAGERHWRRLLQTLACSKPGHYFPKYELLKNHLASLRKPALVFVISDFYQQESEISDFISKLNRSRSEVVALQAVCQDELDFNYRGAVRFKDLETDEEVLVSAGSARQDYHAALAAYQEQLRESLLQQQLSHYQFNIDEPLDNVLFEYLKHRNRMGS